MALLDLRELAALLYAIGFIASTTFGLKTIGNSSSRGFNIIFWHLQILPCVPVVHIYKDKTPHT